MVKSLRVPFVAALAVAVVMAGLPQELQAQARSRSGGGARPAGGGGGARPGGGGGARPGGGGGGSSARAVPRPPGQRPGGPYGPSAGGPRGGGHSYYGRPYGGGYYSGYPYWPVGVSVGFAFGYGGFGWYGGGGYPGYYGYPGYNGYAGYGYSAYGYPGHGAYGGYAGHRPYGGVRIQLPRRQAEVWESGYFVGHVDDFDGAFQQLNLEPGAHRIEIREAGYETIAFDVRVEPGRTIHYRSDMKPVP